MHRNRAISILAASIACAVSPAAAYGQTAAGTTTATATSVTSTESTTGTTVTSTAATTTATAPTSGTSTATTAAQSESRYLAGLQTRYPALASKTNLQSLVHGLRTGSAITLSSTQATSGTTATSTSFTPPTRPMGYGNITRAMTLATRQLAAAGVADPSPQQLQTAMMGGTLTTANGSVQMQGVLQLRSQGMGWGRIAHNIGVQPGTSTRPTDAAGSGASGITTAGSGTAGPAKKTESTAGVRGRGIVTAAGTSAARTQARGRGSELRSGSVVAANGPMGQGAVNGAGHGSAGARAHGGKH